MDRGCLLVALSPIFCCLLWMLGRWGFELWELERLMSLVDESEIPGRVIAKDGRNDWPYGTSNGTYIRGYWLIVAEDKDKLEAFAKELQNALEPKDILVEMTDLGEVDGPTAQEGGFVVADDARRYLLKVSTSRPNYSWELSD